MPIHGEKKREYNKKYYRLNIERERKRHIEKRRRIIGKIKAFLLEYLLSHPCVDCGEADPIVLEFDHRIPKDKLFSMAEARRGKFSLAKVMEEVKKCTIRCANCHRRQTAKQVKDGIFVPGFPVRKI